MILLDIFTYLGRLHPMVVHLPIGFLLLAAIFDGLSYLPRYRGFKSVVPLTLFIGFASAVAACILGYLLSLSGDYDTDRLVQHKVSGILVAILSGMLWTSTTPSVKSVLIIPNKVFSLVGAVVTGLLLYAGHQGGSLTHGSDYLSLETLTHRQRIKPGSAEEAIVFEDVIQPILEQRCEGCHRKGKRKGELMLSSWEDVMKGGKHGPVVVAGNSKESDLYRRVTLDPSHDDFMPSDGKTPLTKTETEMIRWWIDNAAAHRELKVKDIKEHESITAIVGSLLRLPGAAALPEAELAGLPYLNPEIPATLDESLVEKLRSNGFTVRVMLKNPVMLDITLPANSNVDFHKISVDLNAVAKNVIWLNLADNNLTDTDLGVLKEMANLEKLRLEKNPVSDGIVDLLQNLNHLEAVNLNETQLTEAGLSRLQQHTSLKRIYTWKTSLQ